MIELLDTGLLIQTVDEIREEINQLLYGIYGNIDLTDEDPLGQFIGILAERELLIQQQMQVIYNARDVDKNTGASQDSTAAITGSARKKAKPSTAVLSLTGSDGTSIPALSEVSVDGSGARYITQVDQLLSDVNVWLSSTVHVVGQIASNSGNVYICTVAGTSAASGGPATEDAAIVDGTITWRFVGNGTALASDVEAKSSDNGPIAGLSGTITVIETVLSGWESVINLLDVDLGQDIETDEVFRLRRDREVALAGNSTVPAMYAALSDIPDVDSVRNFWNNSSVTDSDGVPPHGLEALVIGGVDQDIINALGENLSGGTATYGTVSGTWEDPEGNSHTISFSRTTDTDIYVEVTLTYNSDTYPSDGDTQIQAAIAAGSKGVGFDVVSSAIKALCFSVEGVLDVSLAYIGLSASPVSETTLSIGSRELGVFDTSRVTVNSSEGVV